PVNTFTTAGTYEVSLTVSDAGGLSDTAILTITVNEENESLEVPSFEFILAPNPATDFVEVIMDANLDMDEIIGVMLHDMSGRLIRQYVTDQVLSGNTLRIPTAIYRSEVYVITLMFSNGDPISKRLVIQN
ncbi:T9SS type A sorting domain-containing protein, partial [Maribacter flavus]